MAKRHLPVRPDLDQLRHQAKDLLREIRRGDPAALADLAENRHTIVLGRTVPIQEDGERARHAAHR